MATATPPRIADTITTKVLSCYVYWLTYGEDDELTAREQTLLKQHIAHIKQSAPEGFTFGHYDAESETFADDFGICDATGQYGERAVVTFTFFKA